MKTYPEKNGAWTVLDRTPSGMYSVKVYSPGGALLDKMRCDNRADAMVYLRAFRAVARNA